MFASPTTFQLDVGIFFSGKGGLSMELTFCCGVEIAWQFLFTS
jgi:hypothetical protein